MKPPKMSSAKTLVNAAIRGSDGRHWYRYAASQIESAAVLLTVCPNRLAGLLSLFSPRVGVSKSINLTLHYVRTGQFRYDTMTSVRSAVRHYELTGEIRGTKTEPFARALRGDTSAVVLDSWMAVAFGLDAKKQRFEYGYIRTVAEKRVRRAAKILGWEPAETQAAIWYTAVRENGTRGGESINRNPAEFKLLELLDGIPI